MSNIIRRDCQILTTLLRHWLRAADECTHALVVVEIIRGRERTKARPVPLREARRFCRRHGLPEPVRVSDRMEAIAP